MVTSLAVAGKGGTGKSTIAAAIILELVARGEIPVLAVDADPDSSLSLLLGLESEGSIADLREEVRKEMKNFPAGMSKAHFVEAGLHQAIAEGDGFDLVTMGRGEGPGCYCYLNSLIKKFSDDLVSSYRWVVMDNEAGLEHISRRTSANVDALITVVTENPLSLTCAAKIDQVSSELKNAFYKRFVVSNMVREDRREAIRARAADLNMEYICDIPFDPQLDEIIFNGRSLKELNDSPVKESIKQIIDQIGGNHGST
ncbi:AAA family ATPase [candidate division KSB1 bacterium]|nr:AAA family ATPase [candidate division KSB1 bacterium]